jgi:hypothetical protein
MRRLLLALVIVMMAATLTNISTAQSKMDLSVGPDILLPMGTFGDAYSIGFGGSVRFQYDFTPMIGAGLESGYFTWSAKSVPAGISAPTFHGIPIRVFGKYYFMPAGGTRFYGMLELGFFIASVTVPSQTIAGITVGGGSASETDFNYAPVVGVELPAGKMKVDISVRYDGIATSGSSSGNIAARVGLNFPL